MKQQKKFPLEAATKQQVHEGMAYWEYLECAVIIFKLYRIVKVLLLFVVISNKHPKH
jgi:hypothetical protein